MLLGHGPDAPSFGRLLPAYAVFYGVPVVVSILPILATVRSGRRRRGILAMLCLLWAGFWAWATFAQDIVYLPGSHFLAIVAVGTSLAGIIVLARYPARLPAAGRCDCGYDLTGNVTGRCPECGALREAARGKSDDGQDQTEPRP